MAERFRFSGHFKALVMTVNELIAQLSVLPEEQRELQVVSEWTRRGDPLEVETVRKIEFEGESFIEVCS